MTIPLGLGNPEDPLYGVLDSESNFFYLVSCYRELAEHAVLLLSKHRLVELVLISDAVNWEHNLIDNSVCSSWGLSYNPEKTCVNRYTVHTPETMILLTNVLYFLQAAENVYYFNQLFEWYCDQWIGMILPSDPLREQFATDPWFNLAVEKETANRNRVHARFRQKVNALATALELDIARTDYPVVLKNTIDTLLDDPDVNNHFKKYFQL